MQKKISLLTAWVILLLTIVWLYAPAVRFGLIWDDPIWFGRGVGQSWLQLLSPRPDFQFYRPLTLWLNALFLRPDGTMAVELHHWVQILWHLLVVVLVGRVSRLCHFSAGMSWLVAAGVGLYPFAHQAVAWSAPQQPVASVFQLASWLTFLLWLKQTSPSFSGRFTSLFLLSLFSYAIALGLQEAAVPLCLVPAGLVWLHRPTSWRNYLPAGAYPVLAALFMGVWLSVPRLGGITSWQPELEVWAYLSQAFSTPLLGRPAGYTPEQIASPLTYLLLSLVVMGGLWAVAVWRERGRLATAGLVWAVLALLPAAFGLPFSYVSLAPRLLYYSAPGVAWLWVAAGWPTSGKKWQLALALLCFGAIGWQNIWLISRFQAEYQLGVTHLRQATNALETAESALFINFPDRYTPRTQPFPLGYWGVTLAPVVVEMGQFSTLLTGRTPTTFSASYPALDQENRANAPFQVDMRGVIYGSAELYDLAQNYEQVWVSRYSPTGEIRLVPAGSRPAGAAAGCALVWFGEQICLQQVKSEQAGEQLKITLLWSVSEPIPPHFTFLVHSGPAGQPPTAQTDGDAWQGMLPLSVWRPGEWVEDVRFVPLPAAGDEVRVGVYNWVDGSRLPGRVVQTNQPLPDGVYLLPAGE